MTATIFIKSSCEYGSSITPVAPAVMAIPAIIIIQVIVAAAARRRGAVEVASRANRDVPDAPTPMPIKRYAIKEVSIPSLKLFSKIGIDVAARMPPVPRIAMPPIIHGVRRPPLSERNPQFGRVI